jgi:hypothetical protein
MPTLEWNQHYGGVSDDPRNETRISFEMVEHFDIYTSTRKLIPLRSSENVDSSDKKITKFLYSTEGNFFGMGVDGAKIEIYELDSVPAGNTWNTVTNGVSSGNGTFLGGFGEYKGDIYGIWGGNKVFKWDDYAGSPTFTDSFGTTVTSPTVVADPIIGSDDEFYMFYDNYVGQIDSGGTWTNNKFILPSEYKIRSAARRGDFLYIAASGDGVKTTSKIFIWDYINADPVDVIDLGLPLVYVIANVDGEILTVSLGEPSSITFQQNLIVKQWVKGDTSSTKKSIPLGTNGFSCLKEVFVDDNRLYFGLNRNDNSDPQYKGVWCVGRKNDTKPWALSRIHKPDNDTTINDLNSFYKLGDFFWVSHGTTGEIDRTDDSETYSATSTAITEIIDLGSPTTKKMLEAIAVGHDPIGSGTVYVDYRVDAETSWTNLITSNTANSTFKDATRPSGGGFLPKDFTQIQFRVRSTGGEVPTSLRAKIERMTSKLD